MKNLFLKSFNPNFFLILSLLFLQIEFINTTTTCSSGVAITDTNCFNNLIIIQNYFRSGQFASDKNGNMFIEYSNDEDGRSEYRLFYGLQKDGRNYFANDNAQKIIQIETTEVDKGRYEAKNLFVSTENDINRDKQYLFTTSSYTTLTELHDLDEGTYKVRGTLAFWNIIDIFSYQYSLFGYQKDYKNIYFCVFTQHESYKVTITYNDGHTEKKDHSRTFTIKKFSFNSFDLNNYNEIVTLNNTDNFNNRVISSFIMEADEILVVFYMKRTDTSNENAKYAIIFYDLDLNQINENIISQNNITQPRPGDGVFMKGFYLKEKYAAFLYFTKGYDATTIQFNISSLVKNDGDGKYSFINKIAKEETYSFISDVPLNEFIKINDERLVFISTKFINPKFQLHILLYDLYNTYTQMKIRKYYYDLDKYQLRKELTAFVFNGFLIFSSTAVTPVSYETSNFNSLLVFFGYPNGTDDTIDISPYLMDVKPYDSDYNIYNYLISKIKIENNIFGYEKVEKINLVSIPDELLFYNVTSGIQDTNPLPNNTFFDANHKLYQNFHLNKTF